MKKTCIKGPVVLRISNSFVHFTNLLLSTRSIDLFSTDNVNPKLRKHLQIKGNKKLERKIVLMIVVINSKMVQY